MAGAYINGQGSGPRLTRGRLRWVSMAPPRTVSIVLPAHDEMATIRDVVTRCRRHTPDLLEVIVVDDGSSDRTAAIAEEAGARVLGLFPNRGKGIALRRGAEAARGDVVVFLDADGQDDPEEIPRLLEALEPGVAMVIGSRFLGRFERGAITRSNRIGTVFLTRVLNLLFASHVTDPIAGFRAVWRSQLEQCRLTATRYDIEVDLLLGLLARGERVVEVPVRRSPRRGGRTGLSPIRDGTRILWRIVARRIAAGRAHVPSG